VPPFEKKVSDNLKLLAMEQATFQINLDTAADNDVGMNSATIDPNVEGEFDPDTSKEAFWSPVGAERVEFWLAANPGESLRPLSRVASGGELSRLMLILRTISQSMGDDGSRTTLVFDEIDSGIGGRVAETVGQRLKSLAVDRQVFCVTHQAQIARFADHHFAVMKSVSDGRTVTTVKELTKNGRVGELARMIGGSPEVEASQATARWLINSARDFQPAAEEVISGSEEKKSK
jgi:DNA repair protein RecN (Recombination protein N)